MLSEVSAQVILHPFISSNGNCVVESVLLPEYRLWETTHDYMLFNRDLLTLLLLLSATHSPYTTIDTKVNYDHEFPESDCTPNRGIKDHIISVHESERQQIRRSLQGERRRKNSEEAYKCSLRRKRRNTRKNSGTMRNRLRT